MLVVTLGSMMGWLRPHGRGRNPPPTPRGGSQYLFASRWGGLHDGLIAVISAWSGACCLCFIGGCVYFVCILCNTKTAKIVRSNVRSKSWGSVATKLGIGRRVCLSLLLAFGVVKGKNVKECKRRRITHVCRFATGATCMDDDTGLFYQSQRWRSTFAYTDVQPL